MFGKLHVVISSSKEDDYEMIKDLLYKMNNEFSISPMRILSKDSCDFYVKKDKVKPLLDKLNNDWDGEIDDCIC